MLHLKNLTKKKLKIALGRKENDEQNKNDVVTFYDSFQEFFAVDLW